MQRMKSRTRHDKVIRPVPFCCNEVEPPRPKSKAEKKAMKKQEATGKLALLEMLMTSKKGASLDMLVHELGWQEKWVRGVISRDIKGKLGYTVTYDKATRTYTASR